MPRDGFSKLLENRDILNILMIISAAVIISYVYVERVDWFFYEERAEIHQQIMDSEAPSPYRYRVLVPFTTDQVIRVLDNFVPYKAAFLGAYAIYDLLSICALLLLLYWWIRLFYSQKQALTGLLFVCATMTVALQNHMYQPWSLIETALFFLSLILIQKKKYYWLLLIVPIATFNRETGLFIPLAFICSLDVKKLLKFQWKGYIKELILFAAMIILWFSVYWLLRQLFGQTEHIRPISAILAKNLTPHHLVFGIANLPLFLGIYWLFAFLGFKHTPQPIRRISLVAVPYLLMIVVYGIWHEVRLLMPLYPFFIPFALSFLYKDEMV